MANSFIDKLLRVDARALKKIEAIANQVISYEETMRALSDEELRAKTDYFKEQLASGKTTVSILSTHPATLTLLLKFSVLFVFLTVQ